MPKKKRWGIWVTPQGCWMEGNKNRKALYLKRTEAKKDCDDFNGMWKGRRHVYEVKEIK